MSFPVGAQTPPPVNDNLDGERYFIGVTNCRYLLWLWMRVSGCVPARWAGARALTDCCTWPCTIPEISRRHQKPRPSANEEDCTLRMSLPLGALIQSWWLSESMSNHPFFFLAISLFNEMMNDVVSPSRTATHTNLLPGIYALAGSYVGHFSLILCCCLRTVFLSVCIRVCLEWRLMPRGVPFVGYICFSYILEALQLVTLEFDHWDKFLIFWLKDFRK